MSYEILNKMNTVNDKNVIEILTYIDNIIMIKDDQYKITIDEEEYYTINDLLLRNEIVINELNKSYIDDNYKHKYKKIYNFILSKYFLNIYDKYIFNENIQDEYKTFYNC